jgi:hypothetical protein
VDQQGGKDKVKKAMCFIRDMCVDNSNRLAIAVFKIDTYLALWRGQPPNLRPEEMRFVLPSTFALWNAQDLSVWKARQELEPMERTKIAIYRRLFNLSHLPIEGDSFSKVLLPEDVQIGLLSIFSEIWQVGEKASYRISGGLYITLKEREYVTSQLNRWKQRLDAMSSQSSERKDSIEPETTDSIPITFYNGLQDDPISQSLQFIRKNRFDSLIFDNVDLYHLFSLNSSCNLFQIRSLVAKENLNPLSTHEKNLLDDWACSESTRYSLWQCANVLRSTYSYGVGNKKADPLAYVAFSSAASVMWAFVTHHTMDGCDQHTKEFMKSTSKPQYTELMALHLAENTDILDQWLCSKTLAMLYGIPLCRCRRDDLMNLFRSRLPRETEWASTFTL